MTVLRAPLAGWAMPLARVADAAFAEGMLGPGLAIEPTGDRVASPAAATVASVHRAGHAVTLTLDDGPALLIHVGIDTVALGGAPFRPLVRAGQRVAAGEPLLHFDLDRIVRNARAATTPMVVPDAGWRVEPIGGERAVAIGDPVARLVRLATVAGRAGTDGVAVARSVTVALPHGLHARPAARIAAAAHDARATVTLRYGDAVADGASVTAMLALGLGHGAAVEVTVQGGDAAAVLDAVADLMTREREAAPAPPAPRAAADERPAGALAAIPAAPGLALGIARWWRVAPPPVPPAGEGPAIERARLAAGLHAAGTGLAADGMAAGIAAAHRALIADPALRARAEAAIDAGAHAAAAILAAAAAEAARLRGGADRRLAERADDIEDVGARVARAILGTPAPVPDLASGTVLLARTLMPSQLAAVVGVGLAGIVLVEGGPTSHVAIMAAGAGVPMLVAAGAALERVVDGAALLVDADAGYCLPDPDADARAGVARRLAARAAALAAAGPRGATADGAAIAVQANLGSAGDAAAAAGAGAEGSGLVRTEFLFLDRAAAPDRAEQTAAYDAIAAALPEGVLTIRLLDIGGDKPAPYLSLAAEENPALGLRGIRVGLARPALLATQIDAILAMRDLARVRIMVPMVVDAGELRAVRAVLAERAGLRGVAPPPLGAMVETPAAAIAADLIGRHADFLSIGSNDLTQYALAVDRGNPAVTPLVDGLHPAVLRLIDATCRGAAAAGIPVGICGGLAAERLAVPILVGLGVSSLSVPPAQVAAVRALLLRLTTGAARDHAAATLACADAAAVRAGAARFLKEVGA